ncbi:MAG: PKD domain-containing protein [Bacteroidota bacterium]
MNPKYKIGRFTLLQFINFALVLGFSTAMLVSCDDRFIIPEEGSLADATPPSADFSFTQDEADYLRVSFANLSISATDQTWDFGDGTVTTEANPTHTYDTIGVYTIKLTVSDKLNATSTIEKTITIEEPVVLFTPEIYNPGFDIEDPDSYRDGWRNGDLGGVIQITSSPVHDGVKSAKLPSEGDRIAYQLITVEENKDYVVSFYYTMKTSPVGNMTVSILAGHITDPTKISEATINSVTVNDQNDASTYVLASVNFFSGNNTEVAIYVSNVDVECRIDSFTIVED